LRKKIYPNSFLPKWSFVKSIPGPSFLLRHRRRRHRFGLSVGLFSGAAGSLYPKNNRIKISPTIVSIIIMTMTTNKYTPGANPTTCAFAFFYFTGCL
jgi:hypothetical protein